MILNRIKWKVVGSEESGGGACRSPDGPWGSVVERALVEREWRREAAADRKRRAHPDPGVSIKSCGQLVSLQDYRV